MQNGLLAAFGRRVLLTVAVVALAGGAYAAYSQVIILMGNFHAVKEGEYYRSAQLDKEKFIEEIDAHHIKSILNLRDKNTGSPWYDDELAAAQSRGERWPWLFGQNFRFDKWNVCRG